MSDNRLATDNKSHPIGVMEAAKSPASSYGRRSAATIVLAALMLALLYVAWPRLCSWQQHRLAIRLVSELEQTSNRPVQAVLNQVGSLGNSGIEALVIAAASTRADIALAARRIIEEQLAGWKIRAEADKGFALHERAHLLSEALATHVDEFGPYGQQWITKLALDLTDLTGGLPAAAAVPVLANCSIVLNEVPALGPRMLTLPQRVRSSASDSTTAALPDLRLPVLTHKQADRWRGRSPASVVGDTASPTAITQNSAAAKAIRNSTELPKSSNWTPEWTGRPCLPAMQEPVSDSLEGGPPQIASGLTELPSPQEMAELVDKHRPRSTRELFVLLHEVNKFEAAAICDILAERGIAGEELLMAARLLAEDPAARLDLVDDLKVLPARTARRWLHELLADEDARVRLKALSALATTNDPELVLIARDLAVRDKDRRVAELALRIMRETK